MFDKLLTILMVFTSIINNVSSTQDGTVAKRSLSESPNDKINKMTMDDLNDKIKALKVTQQVTFNIIRKLHSESSLLTWPAGKYTLWKPDTGCPNITTSNWKDSKIKIGTSTESNKDNSSNSLHLSGKVFENVDKHRYVKINMCSKTTVGNGPVWPKGSYCIQAYSGTHFIEINKNCPDGFYGGATWYQPNPNAPGRHIHNLPGFHTHQSYFRMVYCCRNDGEPNNPIILPTLQPFYLLRFGGTCQNVMGMEVSNEWIHTSTGNWGYKDKYGMFLYPSPGYEKKSSFKYNPDGSVTNGLTTHMCYYKPLIDWSNVDP